MMRREEHVSDRVIVIEVHGFGVGWRASRTTWERRHCRERRCKTGLFGGTSTHIISAK